MLTTLMEHESFATMPLKKVGTDSVMAGGRTESERINTQE
jgi:hypothetical protein